MRMMVYHGSMDETLRQKAEFEALPPLVQEAIERRATSEESDAEVRIREFLRERDKGKADPNRDAERGDGVNRQGRARLECGKEHAVDRIGSAAGQEEKPAAARVMSCPNGRDASDNFGLANGRSWRSTTRHRIVSLGTRNLGFRRHRPIGRMSHSET